jgi:hypothetical protein
VAAAVICSGACREKQDFSFFLPHIFVGNFDEVEKQREKTFPVEH